MKKITIVLAFLGILGLHKTHAQLQNYAVGDTVPNFTITDIHGHSHTLYNFTSAGKYVLVDFFAYWCVPCQGTSPIINSFYKKYGCNDFDVAVLGLESDGTLAQTQDFEDNYGGDPLFPTPTASGLSGGGDSVVNLYGPAAYPTVALISPSNTLLNIDIWPINNVSSIEAAFPAGTITPHACLVTEVPKAGVNPHAWSIFPNPASEFLFIKGNANQIFNYRIFNAMGQEVLVGNGIFEQGINIQTLTSGVYTMLLSADQSNQSLLFSIVH